MLLAEKVEVIEKEIERLARLEAPERLSAPLEIT